MFYISKGIIFKESGIDSINVSRCGSEYNLCGKQAELWLAGRFSVAYNETAGEQPKLKKLESMGLIELAEPDETAADYQLLTNCVICLAKPVFPRFPLNRKEKLIWAWIKNAGYKLTISELVYLTEQKIIPGPEFYGEDNWHTLIHAIYTPETIFDNILQVKMKKSSALDSTVSALLGLLKKKRIILV